MVTSIGQRENSSLIGKAAHPPVYARSNLSSTMCRARRPPGEWRRPGTFAIDHHRRLAWHLQDFDVVHRFAVPVVHFEAAHPAEGRVRSAAGRPPGEARAAIP